jgi:hypothetical protein
MPVVHNGDKVVIIDKRLYRDDNTRLFVGIVEEYDDRAIRARGFGYHVNPYEVAGMERRGEERVRVVSIDAGEVIFILPRDQDIEKLQLKRSPKAMSLTDGKFAMDLSDFLPRA